MSKLPSQSPPQPAYILRGHATKIHSTSFIKANTRLVTGDADGWIVIWSLATKRATAVWRAHESAILESAAWGQERLITHGRDDKLIVWRLGDEAESSLSTSLPVDDLTSHRKQPWLLHIIHVNTLNFCSFAHCTFRGSVEEALPDDAVKPQSCDQLLIAVPNTITSDDVDIFHLPSEKRVSTALGDKSVKIGMAMAVAIFYQEANLTLIVGYESGHTTVSQQFDDLWHILYSSRPHSQPVLGLAVAPNQLSYVTSSADAIIAKHPVPNIPPMEKDFTTRHHTLLAKTPQTPTNRSPFHALASTSSASSKGKSPKIEIQTTPLKVVQTKHSGQQGLKIRSDGKIFATAGWDFKVRVYSLTSLKELAVLKWHKEGCYTVAFADIQSSNDGQGDGTTAGAKPSENPKGEVVIASANLVIKEKQVLRASSVHWLAAGSKDGKVSLWDIY